MNWLLHSQRGRASQFYAEMGIREYWVIDVIGKRIFAFALSDSSKSDSGKYEPIEVSNVLTGLSIKLVAQTIERQESQTNTAAASWFMQQLRNAESERPSGEGSPKESSLEERDSEAKQAES